MLDGIHYLNSLGLHKVKPGLDRIKQLLRAFDNPQDKVPGIIIGGTNGKGSVAAIIASILSAEGYRAGLYTSPHLVNITERIRINDVEISESELSSIILEIKKTAENLSIEPSYFEVITAAAFIYFAREKADFNILEVGLGGRWDATNVISPLLSIITNISLEHTEYLGDTIAEIAGEKACLIKPYAPIITAAEEDALKVIENVANKNQSELLQLYKDFAVKRNAKDFSYQGILLELNNLQSNIQGKYQLNNIAIAIAAIETLSKHHNIKVSEQVIRKGLLEVNWKGRFEIIRKEPPLILDSAHNPGAAKVLVDSLTNSYPNTKFNFMIGMLDDKGHQEFLKEVSAITDKLIITRVPSERSSKTELILKCSKDYIEHVEIIDDYKDAYLKLVESNSPSCITGSIYLVGAIKNLID